MLSSMLCASILIFLAGCAATPNGDNQAILDATPEQQLRNDMLLDLVSYAPQLLEPLGTTIQFNDAESGDASTVVRQLVNLGYGLQRVDADQGKYFLRVADVTVPADAEKQESRMRLSLGGIELTRSYRAVVKHEQLSPAPTLAWRGGKAVVPAGPLLLAGTRDRVTMKGYELALVKVTTDSGLIPLSEGSVQYTSLSPIVGGIPTISLITDELVQQVAQSAFPGVARPGQYVDSFKLENMTHVVDNAFASVADNYNRVGRETVIFPNDSQNLGRPGKLLVKKLIGRFSKNTDLVGIVGCSNGRTTLAIGNEGLALGRAKRIAEEFYTAGISRDKVFNQGCWSEKAGAPGFPNRGVVIDLWRRKG